MMKVFLIAAMLFSSAVALGGGESDATEMALQANTTEQALQAPDGQGVVVQEELLTPEFITKTEPDYQSMDFLGKLMSLLGAIYMGMWMLGEILTRVSVWTENKWDNKAAEYVAQVTWFLGAFAGRMGWKLPKLVIEHEADKIAAKKASAISDKAKV